MCIIRAAFLHMLLCIHYYLTSAFLNCPFAWYQKAFYNFLVTSSESWLACTLANITSTLLTCTLKSPVQTKSRAVLSPAYFTTGNLDSLQNWFSLPLLEQTIHLKGTMISVPDILDLKSLWSGIWSKAFWHPNIQSQMERQPLKGFTILKSDLPL